MDEKRLKRLRRLFTAFFTFLVIPNMILVAMMVSPNPSTLKPILDVAYPVCVLLALFFMLRILWDKEREYWEKKI